MIRTTIRGQVYVAGLHWRAIHNMASANSEGTALAKEGGFQTAVLWRREGSPTGQFGFVRLREEGQAGDVSLAAALAHALGDGWTAIVPVAATKSAASSRGGAIADPEDPFAGMDRDANDFDAATGDDHEQQYALISVTEASAIDDDRVGSLKDVMAWWTEHRSQQGGGFDEEPRRLFAPDDLMLGDVIGELDVNDLLSEGVPASLKLAAITRRGFKIARTDGAVGWKKNRKWVLLGLLVTVVGGQAIYGHWRDGQAEAKRVADDKAESDRKDREAREASAKPVANAPVPPWPNEPKASDFLRACGEAISGLDAAVDGWKFKEATCDGSTVTLSYGREGNRTADEFTSAARWRYSVTTVSVDDATHSTGTVVIPVRVILAPSNEPLGTGELVATHLVSHFQARSVDKFTVAIAKAPDPVQGKEQPRPWWSERTVSVPDTPYPPFVTAHHGALVFDGEDVPGLRIKSLKATAVSEAPWMKYTIEGTLYAKN